MQNKILQENLSLLNPFSDLKVEFNSQQIA